MLAHLKINQICWLQGYQGCRAGRVCVHVVHRPEGKHKRRGCSLYRPSRASMERFQTTVRAPAFSVAPSLVGGSYMLGWLALGLGGSATVITVTVMLQTNLDQEGDNIPGLTPPACSPSLSWENWSELKYNYLWQTIMTREEIPLLKTLMA